MKTNIKMTQALGGTDFTYSKGEELEIDSKTAKVWADKGLCIIVKKKNVKHIPKR